MKFETRSQVLTFIVLGIALVLGVAKIASSMTDKSKTEVAFIGQSKYDYDDRMILEGAELAANEYGIDLQFFAPDTPTDITNQIELVNMAIENGSGAIIISPIDDLALSESLMKAKNQGITIIGMQANRDYVNFDHIVQSDYYDLGKSLADRLANELPAFLKEHKVALINAKEDLSKPSEIERGFLEQSKKYSQLFTTVVINSYEDAYLTSIEVAKVLDTRTDIDALVGLNGVATQGIAVAIEEYLKKNALLMEEKPLIAMGFNDNEQSVTFIQGDILNVVMVENLISMGYLAVENVAKDRSGDRRVQDYELAPIILDEASIEDEAIKKIVFIVK